MVNHVRIGLLLAALLAPAATLAQDAQAVPTEPRSVMSSLDERAVWGLAVGVAVLGLALRRRRRGPVVLN